MTAAGVCCCRLFVLYNLPTLDFLDFTAISDKERREACLRGAFLCIVRPGDEVLQRMLTVLIPLRIHKALNVVLVNCTELAQRCSLADITVLIGTCSYRDN